MAPNGWRAFREPFCTDCALKPTNEQRSSSIDKALLKRFCTPNDLAEVMPFLLAGAAMVTGQTITVDGELPLS